MEEVAEFDPKQTLLLYLDNTSILLENLADSEGIR